MTAINITDTYFDSFETILIMKSKSNESSQQRS